MKLDRLLLALSVFALVAGSFTATATADLIVTLTGLDVNAQFNANGSSFSTHSASLGTASATQEFTVSGLDVAGDGSPNDTAVFSYQVDATNGVIENITSVPFPYGVDGTGDPADHEIDPGEGLAFSDLQASVTFGDVVPSQQLVVNSATFFRFATQWPGGGDAAGIVLEDGSGTPITITTTPDGGADDQYIFTSPQTEFSVDSTAGNGFGIHSIGATFDLSVVPEPSSIALLSMAGFGLLVRRRK